MVKGINIFLIIMFVYFSAHPVFSEEGFVYDSHGARDPFVPLISEGGSFVSDIYGVRSIKDVRLEGIVWDEERGSIAIINGEIFKSGQDIGELKVLEIKRDGVIFDVEGERVKVELREE